MDILIQKAKRHDKNAFVALMEQQEKNMYKVAVAILKNNEDVADAMQETVMTCWEKIHTLNSTAYFKTWLTRILINKCNAIYRRKMKVIPNNIFTEKMATGNEYLNAEWNLLLQSLEDKYRIVIILYYVEEFKVKEIAQILDISESTVKQRLAQARKQMEKMYDIRKGMVV